MTLLDVCNLRITGPDGMLVHGINFSVAAGQWLALIGESGSGKSISAFSLAQLLPTGLQLQADVMRLDDRDLRTLTARQLRAVRGREIAYVFQDYQSAFTPYFTMGRQMDEVLQAHTQLDSRTRLSTVYAVLEQVGLPGEACCGRYPFQLSGGQLQRAALALAMLLKPKLLIADEPTTALDAVSAAKVLNLIAVLKQETNCAVLFITHDLRCVRRYADTGAIMKDGRIVEAGVKKAVIENPQHAYTRNLLAAIPPLDNVPLRLPVGDTVHKGGRVYAAGTG